MTKIDIKAKEKEEKWWDKECHIKKEELKIEQRKLKEGKISGEELRGKRREYRNWIEAK